MASQTEPMFVTDDQVDTVELLCSAHYLPGMDWSATLVFRPVKRGYSILVTDPNRLRRIGGGRKALSWKRIAYWLTQDEVRNFCCPGEQFLDSVSIYGVEPWIGDVFKLCWVDLHSDVVFELSSEQLKQIWLADQTLLSDAAREKLSLLDEFSGIDSFLHLSINDVFNSLGTELSGPLDNFVSAFESYVETSQGEEALILAPFEETIGNAIARYTASFEKPRNFFAVIRDQRMKDAFDSYLRTYVLTHDALPTGVHTVEDAGEIDFRKLLQ
jgi:hypothetical protein